MSEPVIGPTWRGCSALKHLVIFGDSYSAVGYDSRSPHPTRRDPLGVPFPGRTSAEPGRPNWVGSFVTEYSLNPAIVVYDYAFSGSTVGGLENQVRSEFLPTVAKKPDWAPWTAEDTLFVTWVGINDCAYAMDFTSHMQKISRLQEELYNVGARNFLFVDVPPIHRSPAVRESGESISMRYQLWNSSLRDTVAKFSADHPDVTTMTFSSWNTFNRILDDPKAHGFPEEDKRKCGGTIWLDHIHPSSDVHDIVARDFAAFLNAQPANAGAHFLGDSSREAGGEPCRIG